MLLCMVALRVTLDKDAKALKVLRKFTFNSVRFFKINLPEKEKLKQWNIFNPVKYFQTLPGQSPPTSSCLTTPSVTCWPSVLPSGHSPAPDTSSQPPGLSSCSASSSSGSEGREELSSPPAAVIFIYNRGTPYTGLDTYRHSSELWLRRISIWKRQGECMWSDSDIDHFLYLTSVSEEINTIQYVFNVQCNALFYIYCIYSFCL